MRIGRFAPWYKWFEYAAFGRALKRQRYRYLPRLNSARSLLVLGEGDGRALERLLHLAPLAAIDVFEISGEMIALARRRIAYSSRVRFFEQDVRKTSWPRSSYDGVITLFFLDCFEETELRALIRTLKGAMSARAIWLVTDFAIPNSGWKCWHAKLWIGAMYRFFGSVTKLKVQRLPSIQLLLTDAGLLLSSQSVERFGMIRSEVWTLPT